MIGDFRLQLSHVLEGREIEPADAQAFAKADQVLDAVYRKKMKRDGEADDPACRRALQRAQRLWVPYRDAFRAAAPELFGGTPKGEALGLAMATELTRRRTARLREDWF